MALLGTLLAASTLVLGLEIGSLRGQLAVQQHRAQLDRAQLAALRTAESRMSGQLAALTVPTDPLASYDAVCNMPLTDTSGAVQTYYFPCTNSAQTIPQPSGG